MARLISHVHVRDDRDEAHVFGPADELPEWAARKIGAHAFEDGQHPFPEDDSDSGRAPGAVPAKSGRGSSRDSWAAYADEQGVDIPADAGRDDIIQALREAGKPVGD